MPVIKCVKWLCRHPFDALSEDLVRPLQDFGLLRSDLIVLEAFLQLTDRTLNLKKIASANFTQCLKQFLGAMHSTHFIRDTNMRTYLRCRKFLLAFNGLGIQKDVIPFPSLSSVGVRPDVKGWSRAFEELALDPEKVWCWGGWGAKNATGVSAGFPLFPVYARLGRSFTESFYVACKKHYLTRRQHGVMGGLAEFCEFVGSYGSSINADDFDDPYWVKDFLSEFARHYFQTAKLKKNDIRVTINHWNRALVPFFELLANSKVIAMPINGFARIKGFGAHEDVQANWNIRSGADGATYKHILLTPVPLHLTDSEAKELLFRKIEEDFAAVVTWAELETQDIWMRYQHAQHLAQDGQARIFGSPDQGSWLVNSSNPRWLENAAATYKHHGHCAKRTASLYPMPFSETAHHLGLPTSGALLPHAALLVANHAELTTAFLQDLELYDKREKRRGIQRTDAGTYLVGLKRRRGSEDAEQRILLNSRTIEVVEQIEVLTEPLRQYLKGIGNDNWRYLFLTAKSMATLPIKQGFSAQASHYRSKLATRMRTTLNVSQDVAEEIANAFSLKAVRASAGVIVYLKTGSSEKMARALGHKEYSPKLLDHYLPRSIQQFFHERWIRLFQTGMITYAMKDSPNLLAASGFKSMAELDEFLSKHAIKSIPAHLTARDQNSREKASHGGGELAVAVGVSEGILTALLSLQRAVEASKKLVCGRAMYWSRFATHLVAYIESLEDRPDLQRCLQSALRNATPVIAEGLIHV